MSRGVRDKAKSKEDITGLGSATRRAVQAEHGQRSQMIVQGPSIPFSKSFQSVVTCWSWGATSQVWLRSAGMPADWPANSQHLEVGEDSIRLHLFLGRSVAPVVQAISHGLLSS